MAPNSAVKVNQELKFCEEILGFGYLHYGLWDGDPLTLDGLKQAQERYADLLVSFIPPGVKTILDVGCGTGGNALKLTSHGYEVEGVTPDPYQHGVFTEKTGLPCHLTRFQDMVPTKKYDLVLMSESCQYLPVQLVFPAAARVLDGGHLLISDYFPHRKDGSMMSKSGHQMDVFLRHAEEHGFAVQREQDITDAVTPTLDLADHIVDRYALPVTELILAALRESRPYLYRIGKWLLRGKVQSVLEQRVLLDSAVFKRAKRYCVFLFEAPRPKV